jgi:hypothetical protein
MGMLIRHLVSAALVIGLGAVSASAYADAPAARPSMAVASGMVHHAGDAVFVEWGGSMWRATVVAGLADGRAVIHYDGWGDEWDELVTPSRLRTELRDGTVLRADDAVQVEWHGSYWAATILRVARDGYLIHYAGYGAEWDEVVPRGRITRLIPHQERTRQTPPS